MNTLPPTLAPDLARAVMDERRHEADRARLARQARAARSHHRSPEHPRSAGVRSRAAAYVVALLTVLAAVLGTALVLVVSTAGGRLP